jgi:hypothetical protein
MSKFRRVVNVAVFLLGDSPASEFYVPTFRHIVCSEASARKIQTPEKPQNKEYNIPVSLER